MDAKNPLRWSLSRASSHDDFGNRFADGGKVVSKVKAAAPDAKQADIVNSLTIVYCPIVEQDAKLPADLKVATLGPL